MYKVEILAWAQAHANASHIRREVFVREQGVPLQLELDKWDPSCEHALAFDENGVAIATGRLLPDGHIGRVAVLKDYRGLGIARSIIHALLEHANQRGEGALAQNAQADAALFYQMFSPSKREAKNANAA